MVVKAYKTHKITKKDKDILSILDKYLPKIEENSVVIVTSKIVAICEGRIIPVSEGNKDELVEQESEYFLPKEDNKYNISLTIKNNLLIPTAGIDESNADKHYVLWPIDPQKTANEIRSHLKKKNNVKNLGVIITDSKTTPLRWGVTGAGIAHSGFSAINDMIGKPDIFGKPLKVTKVNVMDALSSAAGVIMGEASEQTPLSVITDIPFVEFQDRNPNEEELAMLHIDIDTDLYSTILKAVPWKKGKAGK